MEERSLEDIRRATAAAMGEIGRDEVMRIAQEEYARLDAGDGVEENLLEGAILDRLMAEYGPLFEHLR